MPLAPLRPCNQPGCPELVESGYCEKHQKAKRKSDDSRRDKKVRSLYNYRWQQYSKRFLRKNPLCVKCRSNGRVKASEVTDHIEPHKGDYGLFWDVNNHAAMCKWHHDKKTARG